MVCAFVTNQLLHDQTSSSSSSADDDAGDDTETDVGLVMSLVDSLNAVDSYQRSTSQVIDLSLLLCLSLSVSLCLSLCHISPQVLSGIL